MLKAVNKVRPAASLTLHVLPSLSRLIPQHQHLATLHFSGTPDNVPKITQAIAKQLNIEPAIPPDTRWHMDLVEMLRLQLVDAKADVDTKRIIQSIMLIESLQENVRAYLRPEQPAAHNNDLKAIEAQLGGLLAFAQDIKSATAPKRAVN